MPKKDTAKKQDVNEFKASFGVNASTPEPTKPAGAKSAKRPADKDQGEKTPDKVDAKDSKLDKVKQENLRTKAGMMREIQNVLANIKKEDVEKLYKNIVEGEDKDDSENDRDQKLAKQRGKYKNNGVEEEKDDDDDTDVHVSVDTDDDDDDEDEKDDNGKSDKKEMRKKVKKEDLDLDSINIENLFESGQFTDHFVQQTQRLFETAVLTTVNENLEKIHNQVDEEIQSEVKKVEKALIEKLDMFIDVTVEEFMDQNKLAIESGLKTEMAESLLSGLKSLFEDHYISVPDGKSDVFEDLSQKYDTLESDYNKTIQKTVELKEELEKYKRKEVVDEVSTNLSDVQKDKLMKLAENIEYTTDDEYRDRISELKDTLAGSSKEKKVINEDTHGDTLVKERNQVESPLMQAVLSQLNSQYSKSPRR